MRSPELWVAIVVAFAAGFAVRDVTQDWHDVGAPQLGARSTAEAPSPTTLLTTPIQPKCASGTADRIQFTVCAEGN